MQEILNMLDRYATVSRATMWLLIFAFILVAFLYGLWLQHSDKNGENDK